MSEGRNGVGPLFKGLALMTVLVALGVVFHRSELGDLFNRHWIDARVKGHGVTGALWFIGVGSLVAALGLPRQLLAFMGGYAFGLWGALIAATASLAGCTINFVTARYVLRRHVGARMGRRVARFDRFVAHHPFSMTLMIRLLPAGSNLVTNLVAGVSRIPAGWFLLGSFAGYLPQTFIFALVGSGVQVDSKAKFALAAGLLAVSAGLGVYLYRRYRGSEILADTSLR